MNDHISDTLNRMLHEVTGYSTGYAIRLMSLILLLKDYDFEFDDESISLEPAQGFSVSGILPQGYKVAANTSTKPLPLSHNSLKSGYFNKQYKNMFNTNHLQIIQFTYFGPLGSKTKDPIHTAFTKIISRDNNSLPNLDS
ncbi:hypothetical protein K501DRAFT_307799 [Backusella circina FSU 941]|nr:hypothetical protein K501DRAFT_307799 [Backusella circina FSU 941]